MDKKTRPVGRPRMLDDGMTIGFSVDIAHGEKVDLLSSDFETRSQWFRTFIDSTEIVEENGQRFLVSKVAVPN